MATCLGIYIDKNIIKYAKVSKEKESLKIDAYGIKFYSNLLETINQVVSETFSFKVPISVNISDEMYNYMNMSTLLSKKDLEKAVSTEFESLCYEKDYNPNALESRFTLVNDINDKDKVRVIHISTNKTKIGKILQDFEGKMVGTIAPISISIANIAPLNPKENILIVNMENKTTVTTVVGQKVYDVQQLKEGSGTILDAISEKENSYLKAYEICKNTTIYTMEGRDLQEETENDYLNNIIPTLYNIANQVKTIIDNSLTKINKVYLTGTVSVVNNIDLYFEEILNGIKCEVLKPFFIEDNHKINMKDYIEVNSAIALALQDLEYGVRDINFRKKSAIDKLKEILNTDIGGGKGKEKKGSKGESKLNLKINVHLESPKIKKWILREFSAVVILALAYTTLASLIQMGVTSKKAEIDSTKDEINSQIRLINADKDKVDKKSADYTTLTNNLKTIKSDLTTKNSLKNMVTTLLSQVMNIIPKEVQLTSIENTSNKHIVIAAQSTKYEQLAYFKALLKSNNVLNSVVSTAATKEGDTIKITIEGEVP